MRRYKKSTPIRQKVTETSIQSSFIEWLNLQYPKIGQITFSIPNGAPRSITYAHKLLREGMKAGVPDIMVAYPSEPYHGLFVEFKSPTGTLSEKQKTMIDLFSKQGYKVYVCNDLDKGISEFKKYIKGK